MLDKISKKLFKIREYKPNSNEDGKDNVTVMTKREVMMRYSTPWKGVLFFCVPTVSIMVIQGLYNILDKSLSLYFATNHAIYNWKYIKELLTVSVGHSKGDNFVNQDNINKIFDFTDPAKISIISDYLKSPTEHNLNLIKEALDKKEFCIRLSEMKSYINIATQYTAQSYNLSYSCSQIIALGGGIYFSVEYGKGNFNKISQIAGNGLVFTAITSIFVSALLFVISYPGFGQILISSQMGSKYNPVILMLAWNDVQPLIYMGITIFVAGFSMNMIRSEGKIYHVLIMTFLSIIVKCVVSISAMFFFGLELFGAQLGTIFAFFFQFIYVMFVVFGSKDSKSRFSISNLLTLKLKNWIVMAKLGLSAFILYFAIFVIGYTSTMLVVSVPEVNGITHEIGVSTNQQLISSMTPWNEFILSVAIGIQQGARTIIGFNYGARKNKRVVDLYKRASFLIICWFIFIFFLIISIGPLMMTMFAFPKSLSYYGSQYYFLQIAYFCTIFLASSTYCALTIFQGTKQALAALICSSLRTLVFYIPMIFIGYLVSRRLDNPVWFFLFIGLVDFISSFINIPIIILFFKETRKHGLVKDLEDEEWIVLSYKKYLFEKENKIKNIKI
ncbi:MATE family efflux transporter [Spiroplasma endosymbiont of Aspidapion aeneum]|uniref:MATE family efflux transporter n=1 Tax=Spiroplasma endosymbiont of Aspidapion aeneum TaxID=3066276 RepID=UPI00313AEA77